MIYTFHKPAGADDAAPLNSAETMFDDIEVVPEAISYWAIIFPAPWLILHKLWFELAVYVLVTVLIFGLLATPYAGLFFILSGLPGLYLWLEGHNLRREKLARQGFVLADVVDAENEETAFMRFINKQLLQRKRDDERLGELGLPSIEAVS